MGGQRAAEVLHDTADAHALVRDPLFGAVLLAHGRAVPRLRHAGMMQSHNVPVVVEHRRTRRAGLGVGRVPEHVLGALDELVFAHADLLPLAVRMLDDRQPFTFGRLARALDQRQATELPERYLG